MGNTENINEKKQFLKTVIDRIIYTRTDQTMKIHVNFLYAYSIKKNTNV